MKKKILCTIVLFLLVVSLPIIAASELNLIYDGNGNLITGDGKYREYNGFNQLITVWEGNSSSGDLLEEYIYHPTEERVLAKAVYNDSTFPDIIVYVNENFVRKITNTRAIAKINDTYYAKDENGIVGGMETNDSVSTVFFHHNDHLGSTGLITNSSGDLVEKTFYEPFGAILEGGKQSRFDYEGKEFDPSIGSYDFHFRQYNPKWGMFTQPDSLIQNVYDPQSLNRYAFERNNPYIYTDDDGRAYCLVYGCIPEGYLLFIGVTVVVGSFAGYIYHNSNNVQNELVSSRMHYDSNGYGYSTQYEFEYAYARPDDVYSKLIYEGGESLSKRVGDIISGLDDAKKIINIYKGYKDSKEKDNQEYYLNGMSVSAVSDY